MEQKEQIPTLSLFTGAGGLDIGFHKAGFNIIGCVEIEQAYCKTLQHNKELGNFISKDTKIHNIDIRDFDPTEYLDSGIKCIIGGPPCQTFSAAGRRSGGVLGTKDERGKLFEAYCHILSVLKPKVFVFENVYGLPGANDGEPWREIVQSFSSLGYKLTAEVVDSADYGVPQHRERLIIVGTLDGEYHFPIPTHGPDSIDNSPLVSIWDVIKDLQDPNEQSHDIGGLYGHLLPLVPEGLNYSFFTREMGYPQPFFAWRSKFHDFLYKADRNAPSRTLKAQPGKFTGPFHWKNRHFTTAELKRLQSFPDEYQIIGSEMKVMEQIGNSVPPKLAQTIAITVREQLLDRSDKQTYPVRPEGFQSTFRKRQRAKSEYYKQVALSTIVERFPTVNLFEPERKTKKDQYYVSYKTLFEKTMYDNKSYVNRGLGESLFEVHSSRDGNHLYIEITDTSKKAKTINVKIEITGLSKYLIHIDEVTVTAKLKEHAEIFKAWDIIQEQLTSNSQFFTLIDIYGHYANRGDTVRIKTEIDSKSKKNYSKVLSYIGSSENCGFFKDKASMAQAIGIKKNDIHEVVNYLRELRYDIRTAETHPTIRTDEILCTYPFPLLSVKAQLERKLKA